jgi:hypothetical protein
MTSLDCAVCYFTIEDKNLGIKCSNNCSCSICIDCLISFIDFNTKENQIIPKCIDISNCKGEYLYSEVIKTCNTDTIDKYKKLCFNNLKSDHIDDIILEKTQQQMIEKIRKEKHDFVVNTFPKAISYVILNSLQQKLKKINAKNKNHIDGLKKRVMKKCPNESCINGILDIDYKCFTCDNKFCKKCEIKLKTDEIHECKDEDIESLKLVESFIKCPKCKLPVVRSYGCNNITCSICKTNFDYISGQITIAGNHHNADYKPKKEIDILSLILNDETINNDIKSDIISIKDKEPKIYFLDNVLKYFKSIIELQDSKHDIEYINRLTDKLSINLAENYEKYIINKNIYKNYIKQINKLKESYDNKNLNKDITMAILSFI